MTTDDGNIDFLTECDKLRYSDWDIILRQTKETYKAQLIQLILTKAVIHEIEQNLKNAKKPEDLDQEGSS